MRLWVTSKKGFLGESLTEYFPKDVIYATSRKDVDVTDPSQVSLFIKDNEIDVVLHTAIEGGKRGRPESERVFYNNIRMFENLANCREYYKFMINFGSGAESSRTGEILERKEEFFTHGKSIPNDFYGFSKYIISRRIYGIGENIFNFRIFNIFGDGEEEQRMIRSNIIRNLNNEPFVVHQEKVMDFFSVYDLSLLIEYYLENFSKKELYKDLNICYSIKTNLSDICNAIERCGKRLPAQIEEKDQAPAYCGSSERIDSLGIRFLGLSKSIKIMYEKEKRKHEYKPGFEKE
jgi:dTDP-4-dehydrorhamnose reductase